jgi:hypothetical protein
MRCFRILVQRHKKRDSRRVGEKSPTPRPYGLGDVSIWPLISVTLVSCSSLSLPLPQTLTCLVAHPPIKTKPMSLHASRGDVDLDLPAARSMHRDRSSSTTSIASAASSAAASLDESVPSSMPAAVVLLSPSSSSSSCVSVSEVLLVRTLHHVHCRCIETIISLPLFRLLQTTGRLTHQLYYVTTRYWYMFECVLSASWILHLLPAPVPLSISWIALACFPAPISTINVPLASKSLVLCNVWVLRQSSSAKVMLLLRICLSMPMVDVARMLLCENTTWVCDTTAAIAFNCLLATAVAEGSSD